MRYILCIYVHKYIDFLGDPGRGRTAERDDVDLIDQDCLSKNLSSFWLW